MVRKQRLFQFLRKLFILLISFLFFFLVAYAWIATDWVFTFFFASFWYFTETICWLRNVFWLVLQISLRALTSLPGWGRADEVWHLIWWFFRTPYSFNSFMYDWTPTDLVFFRVWLHHLLRQSKIDSCEILYAVKLVQAWFFDYVFCWLAVSDASDLRKQRWGGQLARTTLLTWGSLDWTKSKAMYWWVAILLIRLRKRIRLQLRVSQNWWEVQFAAWYSSLSTRLIAFIAFGVVRIWLLCILLIPIDNVHGFDSLLKKVASVVPRSKCFTFGQPFNKHDDIPSHGTLKSGAEQTGKHDRESISVDEQTNWHLVLALENVNLHCELQVHYDPFMHANGFLHHWKAV